MPDASGHLYLYEALLLRDDYDRRLKVLERLVTPEQRGRGLLGLGNDDTAEPAPGFEPEQAEEELKGLKARRLKLNRAVQACNVQSTLSFEGEAVTLAEALELRKSLLAEASRLADRVVEAAYRRVVHKEERDVVKKSTWSYTQARGEHEAILRRLRTLVGALHHANHTLTVAFRDE